MKLLSCERCGVVIDQDRFDFDNSDYYEEDGSMKPEVAIWTGDHYVAFIECPGCKNQIETDYKI